MSYLSMPMVIGQSIQLLSPASGQQTIRFLEKLAATTEIPLGWVHGKSLTIGISSTDSVTITMATLFSNSFNRHVIHHLGLVQQAHNYEDYHRRVRNYGNSGLTKLVAIFTTLLGRMDLPCLPTISICKWATPQTMEWHIWIIWLTVTTFLFR